MGPDGLENWHPRDVATLTDILEEEAADRRREARRGG